MQISASSTIRALIALAYSALLTLTLVQPSGDPVVGPAAPPGPPTLEREVLLTAGHIVGFSVLTLVWYTAFTPHTTRQRALWLAVIIALALGVVTEAAQTLVPDRSASAWDMAVNTVVVLASALIIGQRNIHT